MAEAVNIQDGDDARSTIEESPISVDSSPFLSGGRKNLVPSKPDVHENLTDDLDDLERDLDNQIKTNHLSRTHNEKNAKSTTDNREMKTVKVGAKISDDKTDQGDIEEGSDITSEAEVIKTVSESSGAENSEAAIRTIPSTDSSATGIKTIPTTDSCIEDEVEEKKKSKKMKTAAQRKRTSRYAKIYFQFYLLQNGMLRHSLDALEGE